MERLQELYSEVVSCHRNHIGKLKYWKLAMEMLTAASYIEKCNFGNGCPWMWIDSPMNAFWQEMEGNWADLTGPDRERIVKALRWGARQLNGTDAWLKAIEYMDDEDCELNTERRRVCGGLSMNF